MTAERNSSVASTSASSVSGRAARDTLVVLREAHPGELPALVWIEEVAIARPHMAVRRDTRASTQDHLIAHELAVVFADGAGGRAITGIGGIRAAGPFPDVAEQLTGRSGAHARRQRPHRPSSQGISSWRQ